MFLDFYSHFVHTVCLSTLVAVFAVVSAFTSYAITTRTPSALKAYRFLFLHLNGSYQVFVFLTAVFGPFDVTMHEDGVVSFKFYGIISVLGHNWPFFEGFFGVVSICNVIGCVWLSFFHRYYQVCHPTWLYSRSSLLQGAVSVVVLMIIPVLVAASLVILFWFCLVDVPGAEAALAFSVQRHVYTLFGALLVFLLVIVISSAFFNLRVIWILETSLSQASERTKEMQRMLTITLVVQSAIPLVFGILPSALAVYAIFLDISATTVLARTFFLSLTLEGIFNSITTVLLVKPYKQLLKKLLSAPFRRKKVVVIVTVVSVMP
uniref:G protein-coupled receptor n=1 Tax=Steinernema glaseri TaxID=37863 RepID=A0A1I7ZD71_9BILA